MAPESATPGQKMRAHLVHVYTASGVAFSFLAAAEICSREPDPRWVFVWLLVAVLIDATDGPLARRCQVKFRAPRFDGRTIDDIVDYQTFTLLPLLLVWRMDWLPPPAMLYIIPALVASLLGFANTAAKQEDEGFFLGFPSYWNIYAFYAGIWSVAFSPVISAVVLVVLTVLTLAPVRFVYPNLAPRPWRGPLLIGALLWTAVLLAMLPGYPRGSLIWMWISLAYPLLYTAASVYLDLAGRRRKP